jgi:hypothetical protein
VCSADPSEGVSSVKTFLLFMCAITGIAGNAYATESEPTSAVALIREWRALEAACRGSNDPAACQKLDSIGQELGQKGWCFNGYGSGRRWVKC